MIGMYRKKVSIHREHKRQNMTERTQDTWQSNSSNKPNAERVGIVAMILSVFGIIVLWGTAIYIYIYIYPQMFIYLSLCFPLSLRKHRKMQENIAGSVSFVFLLS